MYRVQTISVDHSKIDEVVRERVQSAVRKVGANKKRPAPEADEQPDEDEASMAMRRRPREIRDAKPERPRKPKLRLTSSPRKRSRPKKRTRPRSKRPKLWRSCWRHCCPRLRKF